MHDHKAETAAEEHSREETALLVAATARAYARKEADSRLKHYRNQALIGFLILVAGFAYSTHEQAADRASAKALSYKARGVVCQIIKRGDSNLYQYAQDGTISAHQLHRALEQSVEYRKLLVPAEKCDTDFTAPPARH